MIMAIPFTQPFVDPELENYRRLNQLLLELYEVFQILIRPRPQIAGPRMRRGDEEGGTNRRPTSSEAAVPLSEGLGRDDTQAPPYLVVLPAPDNVAGASAPRNGSRSGRKVLPPRRLRRKQIKSEKLNPTRHSHLINLAFGMEHRSSSTSHHQVSNRISSSSDGEESVCSETKSVKVRTSSLVSLLVPANISGQIWTTLIIIVGWKLLAKLR